MKRITLIILATAALSSCSLPYVQQLDDLGTQSEFEKLTDERPSFCARWIESFRVGFSFNW